jgi:CDP-glucose 4,6-dehydratase
MVTMIQEIKKMYKGKKVFLTGHTGFKGSWMLEVFTLLGAHVKGYSLKPKSKNDLFFLINGNDICESIIADIRDTKRLTKEIIEFQPDFIFHLAAQPLVRESYIIPAETFEVNVLGTANILDAVRRLEKECSIVVITTDKVYQNNEWDYPYRELDRLGGYDPYSASKACTEILINSYRNSFFNISKLGQHKKGIAVARAGNVIGGGDWSKDRIIPDIIKAISLDQVAEIRNPNSIRPWQHVLEPIFGYLKLAINLYQLPEKYSQAYNFGPNTNDILSVKELVQIAIAEWGSGEYIIAESKEDLHEAKLLKLDISKVNFELKWYPKLNSREGIKLTIDWYKNFVKDSENIKNFTRMQILKFLETC